MPWLSKEDDAKFKDALEKYRSINLIKKELCDLNNVKKKPEIGTN